MTVQRPIPLGSADELPIYAPDKVCIRSAFAGRRSSQDWSMAPDLRRMNGDLKLLQVHTDGLRICAGSQWPDMCVAAILLRTLSFGNVIVPGLGACITAEPPSCTSMRNMMLRYPTLGVLILASFHQSVAQRFVQCIFAAFQRRRQIARKASSLIFALHHKEEQVQGRNL